MQEFIVDNPVGWIVVALLILLLGKVVLALVDRVSSGILTRRTENNRTELIPESLTLVFLVIGCLLYLTRRDVANYLHLNEIDVTLVSLLAILFSIIIFYLKVYNESKGRALILVISLVLLFLGLWVTITPSFVQSLFPNLVTGFLNFIIGITMVGVGGWLFYKKLVVNQHASN